MMTADEKKETPQQREANLEMELLHLDRQAEKGTYLSKKSYLCGWVDLYAPDAPPAEWKSRPWKLKIERDPDSGKPKKYRIKPAYAHEAFRHNGLIPYRPDWQEPKPEKLTPETEGT